MRKNTMNYQKKKILWMMVCFFAGALLFSGCSEKSVNVSDEVVREAIESTQQEGVQTEEAQTQFQEEQPPTVTIIMVGDVLLHTRVEDSATKEDGSFDFSPIFENVKDEVAAADLALVNQEVIIGGEELGISGYPAFNAPYEIADELVETGFDVICHGTNHALDKGKTGITNCLNYWQDNYPDIAVLGIHDSKEKQEEIYIAEFEGIRIAILNYTYGTNGISLPGDMPYAVDLLEESRVKEELAKAEKLADFTIVCPHWGTEYTLEKTAEQDKWVEIFYAGGADLVIGTHPHVIEPVEMIEGEKGQMLVYYSLGNFVNWTSDNGTGIANRMVGGMAKVTLTFEADGVSILEHDMLPLVTHVSPGYGGVTTYFLEDYSEELAEENAIRSQDESFSYGYAEQLFQDVIHVE